MRTQKYIKMEEALKMLWELKVHLYQSAFLFSRTKKAINEKTLDSRDAPLQKSTDNKATHYKLRLFKE